MKKITIIGFLFLFIFLSSVSLAQEVAISDVRASKFKGVKSIPDKGYYAFYKSEKNSKGMSTYKFHLYDLDLKPIKVNTINVPKNAILVDEVYNEDYFLIAFLDFKKKTQILIVYDNNGNQTKRKDIPLESKQLKSFNEAIKTGTGYFSLFPSKKEGFYKIETIKEKKYGYNIQKLDNQLNTLWKKSYVPKRGFANIVTGESSNGRLCVLQLSKESRLSKKGFNDLLVFDDKTGNLIGKADLTTAEHNLLPSTILVENDGSIVLGGMYFDGEKVRPKGSDGIFTAKFTDKAQKVFIKKYPWDKELKKRVKQGVGISVLGSKPQIAFHTIKEVDGNYQLIGETYKFSIYSNTSYNSSGTYTSDGTKTVSFITMDFVIFNVDKKTGELKNLQFIPKEKQPSTFTVQSSDIRYTIMAISYFAKRHNVFSYGFTEKNEKGENAIMYFNDDNKLFANCYLGVAPLVEENTYLKTEKINLKRKSARKGRVGMVKSKKGQFLMWELDGKEKQLNLWIEKM